MKNRDKTICILLLGLSIYGLTKLYKKLKKNKSLDSEKYFSAGKYNEYILFYKDRKLDKKELINFVYACQMTSNYQLILEKSENFLKMNYSDDLIKNICKLRILSGLELLKDVSVFKEIILFSVLEKVSFYENENLILDELYRIHNKEVQQIDLNKLSSLLSTFPKLYKEFKSHPIANILLNKDYKNLLNFNDTGPTLRFLYAIINFMKTNDINLLLNLRNEQFFYSKMFYEYVISKQTSFHPSQFQKENASTCFYKALIYRNQSNKSEYISWLNRAINYKDSEFIFIELIKEKISQKNYKKALCICEKALKVFHTDTLLLLEIKILLLEKQIDLAKEKIKLVKNKDSEFYFVNSYLENRAVYLKIAYSLNKLSFLTNFNLGLVLLSENQIECLNYFLNCLSFSLDDSIYYKIFSLTVYLKEIKNLIEFLPNKLENFFMFLKERFCFEYLIFD